MLLVGYDLCSFIPCSETVARVTGGMKVKADRDEVREAERDGGERVSDRLFSFPSTFPLLHSFIVYICFRSYRESEFLVLMLRCYKQFYPALQSRVMFYCPRPRVILSAL